MAKKSRKALAPVPQSRAEFEAAAVELGEGMRALAKIAADAADAIARIKLGQKQKSAELEDRLTALWDAISAYATAHRTELLPPGRKSVAIAAGVIGWRTSTPTVTLDADEEAVIDLIHAAGFAHFLREKTEIDKTAVLADPVLAAKIEGIVIRQVERLFFQPLDIDVERTKALTIAPAEAA